LRLNLREKGVPEGELGPYEQVLTRLGERHEKGHLAEFPSVRDLSTGPIKQRLDRTRTAVEERVPLIYHGLVRARVAIDETSCEVTGEPDFLIEDRGSYIVRDSKISRRIDEKNHLEIPLQMGLYGWLYEQSFKEPPVALQVHSGTGEIVAVPYDGGSGALSVLEEISNYRQLASEPYSPVGWSKCSSCGFFEYCWPRAEKSQDVAMVSGVDQGLALALREKGVETVDDFLSQYDETRLSGFRRPWGKQGRRVGKQAASILRMARALASGEETIMESPNIPDYYNYVMFDLEGLPPHLDETEKIYLWGMQVFGQKPSEYVASTAGFGSEGDEEGWQDFLARAGGVFDSYGDIPFVHWHYYERVFLDRYINRFGDNGGVAARVKDNLLDLLPITQKCIALPVPSYSLKVVEQYIGFQRTQEEYGGDWAMAKYIEATEMGDEQQRQEVMDQILTYNKEDLEATWAVLQWLKSKVA
jgi:predicted RecB family nuclease